MHKFKKVIFYIILSVFISLYFEMCAYAGNENTLSKIENNIYGFDYKHDTEKNRISRLEKTIYGKTNNGDINKRITKLSADISADVIGLEIPPIKDSFLMEETEKEDNSVNYPIVNEIEQKLFNKTFKERDFHTRIVTIEKKLFGKIYDVDDYSKRMDRIKSKIMPETIVKQEYDNFGDDVFYDSSSLSSMEFKNKKHNRFKMPFGQQKYTRPYTNYGNMDGINNDIIPHDNLADDLSQMEYDMFGTEFSSDDTQTRIKRLNSVNKAKKQSSKYDSQKFNQRMSTAMEIGAMILMILAMVL